jgi:hypothetical protein
LSSVATAAATSKGDSSLMMRCQSITTPHM